MKDIIGFITEIRNILPKDRIYTDELRRLAWGTDAGFYRLIPQIVIRSKNEEEVSTILKLATKHKVPLTFRAGGTSLSGQSISDSVLVVAGKNWEDYKINEDGSQISLQPGIIGQRVNDLLKPYKRKFGPDPASIKSAMVGGIVGNNASGMNCGTHANSDRMMASARIILTDGTILDTGDSKSRAEFEKTHADMIKKIADIRDRIHANKKLYELIRFKYSIKNVTGFNLLPFIRFNDPIDIIAHLMVGSEGSLAFLAEVTMKTLPDQPYKATAMIYFKTLRQACEAVVKLKGLTSIEEQEIKNNPNISEDEKYILAGEAALVQSAEMLDWKSLSSVDDAQFLKYCKEVDAKTAEGLTAVLTETKAFSPEILEKNINQIKEALKVFDTYIPVEFTQDPKVYGKFWEIRSGIFPSVGGTRKPGTTCLIEDVAFQIKDLPDATVKLQKMLARYGYDDACIYGHALEGNYHFIINQLFSDEAEVARYETLMNEVKELVVDEYNGSLKAEHGTGRNMAPFVRHEWGDEAYEIMKEVKNIFDPNTILNPGVIINDDPRCYLKNFKPLPLMFTNTKGIEKVLNGNHQKELEQIDKCIECGFCEVNCVSCGFTLSSRQRIVIQRELSRLKNTGEDPARYELLKKQYLYPGNQTCAGDGLCSTSCPMGINVADLTHYLRELDLPKGSLGYNIGNFAANHFHGVKNGLRPILSLASLGHTILGTKAMSAICNGLHAIGIPLWTPSMPKPIYSAPNPTKKSDLKVVYFPSCINQAMGIQRNSPYQNNVETEMIQLLEKAGYQVIFPENMDSLCCGTIWESKGMQDIADRKVAELEAALWKASEEGKYPVLCDQSPCLHRMRKCISKMHMYEPVEFIWTFLRDKLNFTPKSDPIAVHVTCSTREMGLAQMLVDLASLCSTNVLLPDGVGCCAFAGDRGFTYPELNAYALRKLKPQIEKGNIKIGYSNSRTCEIGLSTNSGVPYVNIAYLVNECTTSK